MAANIRSVDFLPEIFQTPVNKQFLNATLDQLTQEPGFKKTQGYIGQKVGPGINPADNYVIEPTKVRNDYQLDPGVIFVNPDDTSKIVDAITYPGIQDSLTAQGASVSNASSLYTSEFYSWDPFSDFDKLVNFSQYYWLPNGPDAVDVSSTDVPLTDNFIVTRANGAYTFSGSTGTNPSLTLARSGSYTFQIAQNNAENITLRVTNDATSSYVINYQNNPTLTLTRGNTYTFDFSLTGIFPFWIKTIASLGTVNQYNTGVTNNGTSIGTLTFVVPQDAPDTLYYCSENEFNLRGQINIISATPGDGPGFWIQTDPGISGVIPATPNISSRDVLGVTNNGTDLGTVQFNVPLATAQNFYYTLTNIGGVDLGSTLNFDQINNQFVDQFLETYGGIDGVTDLNGRTVVFLNPATDPEAGGWYQTTQFDPIPDSGPEGAIGTFDTTLFDQATPITDPAIQFSIWQITYITTEGGGQYIQLNSIAPVNSLEKFSIMFGATNGGTSWYKNSQVYFQKIPLLTADRDYLFYQDGVDPEIFGLIRIVDPTPGGALNIDNIVGQKNYTAPNGVVFTNGLKVVFRGNVTPSSYQNNEYYVEGVGTAIKLLPVSDFITPEDYARETLIADSVINSPVVPDYITINRASPDLNPWTRSNRWFHIDVINSTADYNNTIPVLDNNYRAKRPIIEFRAGTKLFNFGTSGLQPVDLVVLTPTNALNQIAGLPGYSTDGYTFVDGSRVIFANDTNPNVRDQIYTVQFIVPDTVPPLIAEPLIVLTPTETVLYDQNVVSIDGASTQGETFRFDGTEWISTQQKTKVNQAPLFDVYDGNGISFSDQDTYPSSTFTGSKLFSYAVGAGTIDSILDLPIKYLTISNIGEIVFNNNLYNDTFVYVPTNTGVTVDVSSGFVRQYSDRITFIREIGWQTAAVASQQRQQFQFTYDGTPLLLDVKVNSINQSSTSPQLPPIQLYVDAEYIEPANYTVITTSTTTSITLTNTYALGAIVEVLVLSDQVSPTAFYQIPVNLQNNPLNGNSPEFTLGTIRNHYGTIAKNLINFSGVINGSNNTRDLGDIVPYGQQILQQSSPLTLTGYFMRSQEYNIFASLEYNNREYIKFKSLLLDAVTKMDIDNMSVAQILDTAITEITQGKTSISPFYWSDMLPSGVPLLTTNTTVTAITTSTFNTSQVYDFTSANYLGLLVYITPVDDSSNQILLERDVDYVVSADAPKLTLLVPLNVGDIVSIVEYNNTAGSFVPNTPSKIGLYPKFLPEIYFDPNYIYPRLAIRGHDGSVTVAFDDIRDAVLLEFEKRIYNNIKTDGNPIPLTLPDVDPGFFRTTGTTYSAVQNIFNEEFLTWVGWNKVDYQTQEFIQDIPFTYNYTNSKNKINGEKLLGAWRGIYRYFYDTESPDTTPWEMIGLSEKPLWWEDRYGPAPWTSNNKVLWDDLAGGYVADPVAPYFNEKYVRAASWTSINPSAPNYEPGRGGIWFAKYGEGPYPLLDPVIPVGSEGRLLPPIDTVVGIYDATNFRKSWAPGDGGPAEAAWWTSSSYPFSVMRVLALTKPAQFFSLFADRDLYRYNAELGQYLYNDRYRLDARGVEIYGNGVSKASYINWIIDYNQQLGINSTTALTKDLQNLNVRLCYRMASFTEQQNLKIYVERSSPNSNNSSLLLPPESYNLLLYKNPPFNDIVYSSVTVEMVDGGYSISGYSNSTPYFQILASIPSGATRTVSAGGTSVKVPTQYTTNIIQLPYGYIFDNVTGVVDFLLGYGKYLESQGLLFENVENGFTLNWNQMAQEFLYWSNQGWTTGTIINLNPAATKLTASRPLSIVDTIVSTTPENMLLDQNRQALPTRNLIVQRDGNTFSVSSTTNQTISYLRLRYINYEDMIVFDDVSLFSDLVYDPITAARQNRMMLSAYTSTDWDGQLNARGFILNQNNVKPWVANKKYTKGEIVLYKNQYWQAANIVQPKLEFDYADWNISNYDRIEQGLLPNLANKADQLANSYNTYTANLNSDNDLLAYGLIGFRPRQYMAALNLDDVSQVNLYQQFLPTKGTVLAAELFTRADLGKETGAYDIYENWGILNGTYGAQANRSYIELRLNEAYLHANPSTVQVIEPEQSSIANQTILVQDIWAESYKVTSPNIFTTIYAGNQISDVALPSAGYVNLDDVDVTVFSLEDPSSISQYIDNLGIGTTIWAAKSNSYDWNIYRCEVVPGRITQVTDNLNSTSVVQFTQAHNLSFGDLIVIRFFNSDINGVYRVLATPTTTSVVISYAFNNTNQTTVTGNGIAFFLQTARVSQASDVINLPYANSLLPGARVWVDNNGSGHWEVIEKQSPFTESTSLDPTIAENESHYGSSITQAENFVAALVGAPNADGGVGAVYSYYRDAQTNYVYNTTIILDATDVAGFGNAVDFGKQTWAVAGASESNSGCGYALVLYLVPGTNTYLQSQLLLAPNGDESEVGGFGTSVAISQDEYWMYIGSPKTNKVYAYGRTETTIQKSLYTADGVATAYSYATNIEIDPNYPDQLIVAVGSYNPTFGVDYSLVGGNVIFTVPPEAGLSIVFTRRQEIQFTGDGSTDTWNLVAYLYTATSIATITVVVDGVTQRPGIDYTFTGTSIEFTTTPSNGAIINVASAAGLWDYISTITVSGLDADARFGESISTTEDGRTLIVGAPGDINNGARTGSVYAFDRSVVKTLITESNSTEYLFAIPSPSTPPIAVLLNGTYLTNTTTSPSGQYTIVGSDIALMDSVILTPGDSLEIETNEFQLIQKLESNYPEANNEYGRTTKICHYSCSVYIGEPKNSYNGMPQVGAVDRYINQSRLYGITTSLIANPTLTEGATIRINNVPVAVPADNTVAGFATAINAAQIPNIIAQSTTDLTIIGDGVTKQFDIGTIYSSTEFTGSPTTIVYVNDVLQTAGVDYTYNNSTEQINFVTAPTFGSTIVVVSGRLVISVINAEAAISANMLTVLPGVGTSAFDELGFNTYPWAQEIRNPNPSPYAFFGSSIDIDTNSINLVVGAPNGNVYEPTTFDANQTYFDQQSTTFFNPVANSGVAYTFNYLPSANPSVSNPGNFVFGQQIYTSAVMTGSLFGTAVNYTNNRLLVGTPGPTIEIDITGETQTVDYGDVSVFANPTNKPSWAIIRVEQPVVDVYSIDTAFMFDRVLNSSQTYFDFFDPLQGKILGVARKNIDYIGAVDPASYNNGVVHNNGNSWASEHVGQIWWDTDTVRFINPNQDDISYASRRWGQTFPGSTVDIYQWVASSTPPASYTGPGTVLSTTTYTTNTGIDQSGIITTEYYFWVKGLTSVATGSGKTLSPTAISRYIQYPSSSGIPYIAALNASTVAIYNAVDLISAADTILHIGFDKQITDANIHTEYQLIADGRADSFLSSQLYQKFQDSLCGVNVAGATVPDPTLPPGERYGVQFRPRQSMFVDRYAALKNYLNRANTILAQFPIVETRRFNILNSAEPIPAENSGAWNAAVPDLTVLGYQNLNFVPTGYLYLVLSDSSQQGEWTIYQVTAQKTLQLTRIQNYDTRLYWYNIDWYRPGYNSSIQPVTQVSNTSGLDTLTLKMVPVGASVKVLNNGQGKFEIYLRTDIGWDRVGLQDGTIQFKQELWDYTTGSFGFDADVFDAQYFDEEPVIETRKVIQAINEELFIDDLAIERNRSLMLMFNFIYTELQSPSWLIKTSLIDVDHRIRSLLPYQIYLQDNQTFVLDYIQEVKPYHVQVREFNLIYTGIDTYPGSLTDFDVPAYWNTEVEGVPQFTSPVLTPYTVADTTIQNTNSDAAPNAAVWAKWPWSQWYGNYLLEIQGVTVVDPGTGYTVPPVLTVTGECVEPAELTAIINSSGQVVGVNIINAGYGYTTTAIITVTGGNGTGAVIVAQMGNDLVRSISTTIKYDRYQYTSDISDWTAGVTYEIGTQVRYIDRVWVATVENAGTSFDPLDWEIVDAATLSGVDRTQGFYAPTVNQPGRQLSLVIDGIDYPGVQVADLPYSDGPGYDTSAFDVVPYDNIAYDENGLPTYAPGILDAVYESSYLDIYLGTRPTDINVDGGAYVDTFSSHAPEELIPGAEFDTLDMRIFETGGLSWRIFQDMRGVQATYRITPATTTELVEPLSATDDIIYVADVNAIPTPYFGTPVAKANVWGVITINGERIMYRYKDVANNTVSGLLRGTAGTGADSHEVGAEVYDMSRYNLVPPEYQNVNEEYLALGDGSTVEYITEIDVSQIIPNYTYNNNQYVLDESVEVYIGGQQNYQQLIGDGSTATFNIPNTLTNSNSQVLINGLVQTPTTDYTISGAEITFVTAPVSGDVVIIRGYTIDNTNPLVITFVEAPPAGVEVAIIVKRTLSWYYPGYVFGTSLNDTDNAFTRFVRGE